MLVVTVMMICLFFFLDRDAFGHSWFRCALSSLVLCIERLPLCRSRSIVIKFVIFN